MPMRSESSPTLPLLPPGVAFAQKGCANTDGRARSQMAFDSRSIGLPGVAPNSRNGAAKPAGSCWAPCRPPRWRLFRTQHRPSCIPAIPSGDIGGRSSGAAHRGSLERALAQHPFHQDDYLLLEITDSGASVTGGSASPMACRLCCAMIDSDGF